MSEATPDPAAVESTVSSDVSPETRAPEAPVEETSKSVDPKDYDARILADPQFALTELKKARSEATRFSQKLKEGELAMELARQIGSGDMEAGANEAYQRLVNYQNAMNNPRMASLLSKYLETGNPPGADDYDDLADPADEDPTKKEIDQLRSTVTRLQGRVVETDVKGHLQKFFEEWNLTDEAKGDVLSGVLKDFQNYQKTPAGQEVLANLTYQTVETLALPKIKPHLKEIGKREAQREQERSASLTTDVGGGVRTTGREALATTGDIPRMVEEFARELGHDLRKPPVG